MLDITWRHVESAFNTYDLKNTCHPHLSALAACSVRRCRCKMDQLEDTCKYHPEWVLRFEHQNKELICVHSPNQLCKGCIHTGLAGFLQPCKKPFRTHKCQLAFVRAKCPVFQPASAANSLSESQHIESTPSLCNLEHTCH
jgi:hypothetical protein